MKKPFIQFPDFEKLDIRVGEVIEAVKVEGSRNLIKMKVDLGVDYGIVEIISGIAQFYQPENLTGNKFAFLANLEPRKLMGHFSNGMILVADDPKKFKLMKVSKSLQNGLIIR